jgi:hypothetical protein
MALIHRLQNTKVEATIWKQRKWSIISLMMPPLLSCWEDRSTALQWAIVHFVPVGSTGEELHV